MAITEAVIYISDGEYVEDQSVTSAVSGGKVTDTYATGIKVSSDEESLNGLYVTGDQSAYTLSNSEIDLSGNGSNDFDGTGAGAMANDGATLVIKNVDITTNGCIRSAATVTGSSILKVYNSTFTANGGTLPDDYVAKTGPGMMEPPSGLGISGTCRCCLTMDNSKSYYYDSTIISDGWGALSTDSANGYVYMEANNCKVQTVEDGYCAYADNGCHDVFNNCQIDSAAMAIIMAGVSDAVYTDTEATCGTYFAMIHNVMGSTSEIATLTVNGGSIATDKATFYVKSANADIIVDGAAITSDVLLQTIINDDSNRTVVPEGETVYGINAVFKNMTLAGSVLHEDTERTTAVSLVATTLAGDIQDATITIDDDSKWTATADSVVTLGSASVDNIDAATGVTITATAGTDCTLSSGTYTLASGGSLVVSAAE
ncbi:MAG: hypothetical protein H6Q73_4022 [Firmicutes bacterium]|nr:hypothetical protein [Bacillota bacterium]